MRDLRYGIEIEMTGLSRGKAAETLAGFFGTRAEHTGGSYDAYAVRDAQDRVWKLVSDGSIQTQKKVRGQTVAADSTYSVELVSPVCVYEDIGTIQEIVRALRRNNALVNDSCGIHVHVGAEKFDAQHLRNITNIMASKEELIYKALQVEGCLYEREIVHRIWEQSGSEANGTALSDGGSGMQRDAVRP